MRRQGGPSPFPPPKCRQCAFPADVDYFRMHRNTGLDRLLIGYTELNQANAALSRHKTRPVRNPRATRRGRYGRSLPGARHSPKPRRGPQNPARRPRQGPLPPRPLRAGSARRGRAQSPQHRRHLRCRRRLHRQRTGGRRAPARPEPPPRRARLGRCARAVAALNHPNIVAIYDVGDGYIVSELVDGEPLRAGKLSLRRTIEAAVQIASGLAAAHDAGIAHRDLKPDNILLTRDGRPKILDFGLAKVQATRAPAEGETVTVRTEAGVEMGTPGYMSPEQVRGLATDHRSDIFSFGVILHELLSGKRAFHGETSMDTMQAILREEAPELPETVPAGVRQIVAHCLEKEASRRFQSAHDLGFALSA